MLYIFNFLIYNDLLIRYVVFNSTSLIFRPPLCEIGSHTTSLRVHGYPATQPNATSERSIANLPGELGLGRYLI